MATALITTTTVSEVDCLRFSQVTGLVITSSEPTGTVVRYLTKIGNGNWQKYDTTTNAWVDVATQTPTAASVLSEGNIKLELEGLGSTSLASFVGKRINFAVGMSDYGNIMPSITSIDVNGLSGTQTFYETITSSIISLSDSGAVVPIINIVVDKTEENGGTVTVTVSLQDENNGWGEFVPVADVLANNMTGKAIIVKAELNAPVVGTSKAMLRSVVVKHHTDTISVFGEGKGAAVSKTYDFANTISKAHLVVKHPVVQDTEFSAEISLRKPPTNVTGEILAVGNGSQQTVTLAHTDRLANHGLTLYFDGVAQQFNTYAYSPNTGQITFTAGVGVVVSADYIYDWEAERFVPMEHANQYINKDNASMVNDEFTYNASSADDPIGSVGTVRVTVEQKKGTLTENLGLSTGRSQAFTLKHHAKEETIKVEPEGATFHYNTLTDVLTVTAEAGNTIVATYDWAARTNYIDDYFCIFNE